MQVNETLLSFTLLQARAKARLHCCDAVFYLRHDAPQAFDRERLACRGLTLTVKAWGPVYSISCQDGGQASHPADQELTHNKFQKLCGLL